MDETEFTIAWMNGIITVGIAEMEEKWWII